MSLIHYQYLNGYQFDVKSQASTEGDQNHDFHNFYQDGLIQSQNLNQRICKSKLKSSLCKNYIEKGYCPYGPKCQFAHGPSQLKINNQINTCYKTKPCHAFLKKGYCQFGYRCNFVHQDKDQKQFQNKDIQITDIEFKSIIQDSHHIKSSKILSILNQ